MRFAASFTGLLLLCVVLTAHSQQTQTTPAAPAVSSTVVVLGQLEPAALGESARTVTQMDAQAHPLASQDAEDYLRTDASVDIQQRAGAGVLNDISVRGASFEQTLVLVNGFRIDDAETAHFNLDLPVPLGALGGINVLHGEGSTQYGSDAIGGAVDFLTLDPLADTLRLRAGAGSFGEDQEGVLGSLVGKRWSEVAAGDRDRSTGFANDRDYRSENASSETRFASPLGRTNLLFAGDGRAFGANDFYGPYNSWERTKGWFAAVTQQLGEHTVADADYRRHSDIFVLLRDDPSYYKNQHIDDSYEGDIRDRRELFHHGTLLTGIEETTDEIHSNSLGNHGRNRAAGFAEFEWRVPQKWSVAAGLREEFFDGSAANGGTVVSSPMASATRWLPHALKLRAAVGHGFRQGTYVDLYYNDPVTIGNPKLKPESAWNYEGGLDWYPTGKLAATLTVFTSRQTDTIDYTRASPAAKWQATNLGALNFTGIESSLDWQPGLAQHLKLGYTFEHGTQSALNGLQSEYVFNYPTHNARIEWTWNVKRRLLLQSRLGVVQRYGQTEYPVLSVSAVHETGRWRPYLQATNLTNTGYAELSGPPPVRMPGRGFTGGVELVLTHAK
jgi:iron complex outermembrane receptor protein